MTKYIRTKTKIEKIETTLTTNEKLFDYLAQFDNYKNDLIKVADTIEELCDEFVIIDDLDRGINTLWHTKVFSLEEIRKMVKYNEIYAAIWTEWGLKYVAKMNEKGELELL